MFRTCCQAFMAVTILRGGFPTDKFHTCGKNSSRGASFHSFWVSQCEKRPESVALAKGHFNKGKFESATLEI